VNGAVVVDLETGKEITVRARSVINATGVWTEDTEALAGSEGGLRVLASKGVHLVVPRERIRGHAGLILQTEKSVLFVIPWSRYWIIGTTDTPWNLDPTHPVATSADIDYVLDHANAVLAHPLTRADIIGTYAGLRPLLQPGTKAGTSSAKVSREHTVASPTPGLTVIAGGKLTTYRVMAKDAVDFAIGQRSAALPSITHQIPLTGAVGLRAVQRQARTWGKRFGWTPPMLDHLLHRYGANLAEIVELCDADPTLAQPLEHAPAYLRAEVYYAVSHEGALHLEDVLAHRTRLVYEVADRGTEAAEEVASVVGPLLGWDASDTEREVRAWQARIEAERHAEEAPDDEAAEQARLTTPDVAAMQPLRG
jgi:glycerol-3-phosphate dehydrogenase